MYFSFLHFIAFPAVPGHLNKHQHFSSTFLYGAKIDVLTWSVKIAEQVKC